MGVIDNNAILFGLLTVFSLIGYLAYKFTISCSNKQKFNKRHDIRLIETKQNKFAVCVECGGRWEIDEVDEMIFTMRARRRSYTCIDI